MIIGINGIERETEKAYLVNVQVTWNYNGFKDRQIWMPKTACKILSDKMAEVEGWLISKLSETNTFHGYRMNFNQCIEL